MPLWQYIRNRSHIITNTLCIHYFTLHMHFVPGFYLHARKKYCMYRPTKLGFSCAYLHEFRKFFFELEEPACPVAYNSIPLLDWNVSCLFCSGQTCLPPQKTRPPVFMLLAISVHSVPIPQTQSFTAVFPKPFSEDLFKSHKPL